VRSLAYVQDLGKVAGHIRQVSWWVIGSPVAEFDRGAAIPAVDSAEGELGDSRAPKIEDARGFGLKQDSAGPGPMPSPKRN
jgi:hypothetical protein